MTDRELALLRSLIEAKRDEHFAEMRNEQGTRYTSGWAFNWVLDVLDRMANFS